MILIVSVSCAIPQVNNAICANLTSFNAISGQSTHMIKGMNIWCDLGKSMSNIWHFQFSIWRLKCSFGVVFCWKPHLNWASGSKVMSNWRIFKTKRNKKINSSFWLYDISKSMLPTSDWFHSIVAHISLIWWIQPLVIEEHWLSSKFLLASSKAKESSLHKSESQYWFLLRGTVVYNLHYHTLFLRPLYFLNLSISGL